MVNRAIYAGAPAEAVEGEGDGEVALSVDTIQQSLDVRQPPPPLAPPAPPFAFADGVMRCLRCCQAIEEEIDDRGETNIPT